MNLRGIVSVSGKPGLYRVIGQNKAGFVLESLDEAKTKIMTNATSKLATLEDITIFGEDDEDISLVSVLEKMKSTASEKAVPDAKADGKALRAYFSFISPEHDQERVYGSDIKKIVSWYGILSKLPLFDEQPPEAEPEAETTETESAE